MVLFTRAELLKMLADRDVNPALDRLGLKVWMIRDDAVWYQDEDGHICSEDGILKQIENVLKDDATKPGVST
jgi:hypothetical protein